MMVLEICSVLMASVVVNGHAMSGPRRHHQQRTTTTPNHQGFIHREMFMAATGILEILWLEPATALFARVADG